MQQKSNRWKHGLVNFQHPTLEDFVGPADGLFPLKGTLDQEIGEEVVLYLRDQTPFMESLSVVRPFELHLKTGAGRNEYGPLGFLVFWVPIPSNPDEAFAAYDVYINPHSEDQMAKWRMLAGQSHWHLFLIGAGNQQEEFFEFQNVYGLNEALDSLEKACGSIPLVDFNRAKGKFMNEHSVEDLLRA